MIILGPGLGGFIVILEWSWLWLQISEHFERRWINFPFDEWREVWEKECSIFVTVLQKLWACSYKVIFKNSTRCIGKNKDIAEKWENRLKKDSSHNNRIKNLKGHGWLHQLRVWLTAQVMMSVSWNRDPSLVPHWMQCLLKILSPLPPPIFTRALFLS